MSELKIKIMSNNQNFEAANTSLLHWPNNQSMLSGSQNISAATTEQQRQRWLQLYPRAAGTDKVVTPKADEERFSTALPSKRQKQFVS
jgi:hypothetical protein